MNKIQLILLGVVILLGVIFGGVLYHNKHQKAPLPIMCPTDTMSCPDGTSVPRSGASCEFEICKQELPSYMQPLVDETVGTTTSEKNPSAEPQKNTPLPAKKTIVKKVTESASQIITNVVEIFTPTKKISQETSNQAVPQTTQTPTSEKNAVFNETRYSIKNGSIVDETGKVIYTFPPSSTSVSGWTTHVVNVVPTNSIVAIINSIPIIGQPGQFYLSENSLGNIEACEFSNKVYILDTKTGNKVLMYEENTNTIGATIARSCTSELYLLATENEKLILKSHTVGTGTVCESTWSEPEQTWYLDVTKLEKGLRRYIISPLLYYKAEKEETECRKQYEATSTQETTLGG